jgi:hypothetical protein
MALTFVCVKTVGSQAVAGCGKSMFEVSLLIVLTHH